MNWLRGAEIAVYALLNLLPYLVLALLAFRDELRFSRWGTMLLTLAICPVQILLGLCAALFFPGSAQRITLISYTIYILFYLLAVRTSAGKLLFVLFLVCNFASLFVTLSKYLEYRVFPATAMESYRWTFSLATLFVQLVALPPLALYIRKWIRPALRAEGAEGLWRYMWIIPFTSYLEWYYAIYFAAVGRTALEMSVRPETVAFLLAINVGFLLMYSAVARMIVQSAEKNRLQEENQRLSMQNLQLSHLQDRMEAARRARHDMRQHYNTLMALYRQGQYDALGAYLERESAAGRLLAPLAYCAHPAVNAVTVYYMDKAREQGVKTEVALDLPETLAIPDGELTVLLGNLLENALEACRRQTAGEKSLRLFARCTARTLLFTVVNSCDEKTVRVSAGKYLSSKRPGAGVGMDSVCAIATEHGGTARFGCEAGSFRASVLLYLPE